MTSRKHDRAECAARVANVARVASPNAKQCNSRPKSLRQGIDDPCSPGVLSSMLAKAEKRITSESW